MNMPAQPDLFELNKITHQEHLENLMILLTYDDYANGWVFIYELSGSGFESSCSHLLMFIPV